MAAGDSIEMQRMQEEALRRAREMYERARASEQNKEESSTEVHSEPPNDEPPKETENRNTPGANSRNGNPFDTRGHNSRPRQGGTPAPPSQPLPGLPQAVSPLNAIETLFQDKEKSLILMLLVLLSDEGNYELLFVLMSLLM